MEKTFEVIFPKVWEHPKCQSDYRALHLVGFWHKWDFRGYWVLEVAC